MATAAAGQGIAVIPSSYRIENSALHYVEYDSDILQLEHSLVWREEESSAVRTFVDEARAQTWPRTQPLTEQNRILHFH